MQSFEWVDAESVEQAVSLLGEGSERKPVVAKAGGMDLLDLMKGGVVAPHRVVNLKTIKGLDGVRFDAKQGLELGALVTLSRLSADPEVRRRYVALAEAAEHAATPQVRNAATIGGNLLQRPRCWYFRHDHFHQAGGDDVQRVREGQNQYHAIFDNQRTVMVHASTPATALVAYGASVELTGPGGKSRVVPLSDLPAAAGHEALDRHGHRAQRAADAREHPGAGGGNEGGVPQAGRAGELRLAHLRRRGGAADGGRGPSGRRRSPSAGSRPRPGGRRKRRSSSWARRSMRTLARQAAKAAVSGATPLSKNAYKVPVLEAVIRRTVLAAAAA